MTAGVGIGMVIAALCMLPFHDGGMSDYEIERAAKELGMIYPGSSRAVQPEDSQSTGSSIQPEDEQGADSPARQGAGPNTPAPVQQEGAQSTDSSSRPEDSSQANE